MSPQERQTTIDFILRSQADAVIRMERWEERSERKFEEQQHQIEELALDVREAAKAAHDAAKAGRDAIRANREHERRIRSLEKSKSRITRRFEGMRDILRILTRLEARSAKRLDQLEKR